MSHKTAVKAREKDCKAPRTVVPAEWWLLLSGLMRKVPK